MIEDKILLQQLKFIQRCIWGQWGLLDLKLSHTSTRAHDTIHIQLDVPKTQLYRNSLFYYGFKQWNNLPSEIKSATSIYSFKSKLKNLFFFVFFYVWRFVAEATTPDIYYTV